MIAPEKGAFYLTSNCKTLVAFRSSLCRVGFHKMALVVSISIFFVTNILFVITRCLFYFQVATQVAVLISKIARMELREWPELLPTLLKVCLYIYICMHVDGVNQIHYYVL